jgi:hypothetical protein
MAFFLKYPPENLQKELVMSGIDNFGFSTGKSFGKFEFRSIDPILDVKLPNAILVSENKPFLKNEVIKEIKSPAGEVIFKIIDTSSK